MQLGFEKSKEEGRVTEQLHGTTSPRYVCTHTYSAVHTKHTLIKSQEAPNHTNKNSFTNVYGGQHRAEDRGFILTKTTAIIFCMFSTYNILFFQWKNRVMLLSLVN